MATATLIAEHVEGWAGDAYHYRLDPPLEGHEYVMVSEIDYPFNHYKETEIVPVDENGGPVAMVKLPGSLAAQANRAVALLAAGGYSIVIPEPPSE
ncbi:hypothetical protein [Rhodococcus opacus]|uniref:Uncharacterized protein n=1 Tax=Rhodococcus opacus TaxID=37919 RepID=A0A2S8JBZ4_RHOOP|nr:hypothetical protein [Rhodococcus opacus]PQP24172.1 hypothetical protein C5613_14930 [Rhodococcus opacus]